MRVVIDTNVLVSYLLTPQTDLKKILDQVFYHCEILRSSETYSELSAVIMRVKFDKYISIQKRELFLASFFDISSQIMITERIQVCRDQKNNKFLELAVAGNTDVILTGDNDLLSLNPFRGVRIVSPSEFNVG